VWHTSAAPDRGAAVCAGFAAVVVVFNARSTPLYREKESSMASTTIAAYLAATLAASGVERIWGVTGDSLNGLAYSLDQLGSIRWMHTRHEEAAAFAAGADVSRCAPAVAVLATCI
jgi:hypothetical protein